MSLKIIMVIIKQNEETEYNCSKYMKRYKGKNVAY